MKKFSSPPQKGFQILHTTPRSQIAGMILAPGESTGGPANQHRAADQWLFVLKGRGVAIINGQKINLKPNDFLLIEAGENHEIKNKGTQPLETVKMYAPPEY